MRRIVPFSAAGWEAVRFFLLFLVMSIQFNRGFSGEVSLFLLWVSVVSLVAPAALLFVGAYPERYGLYTRLVVLIKLLQVLFGAVLILYLRGIIPFLIALLGGSSAAAQGGSQLASSLTTVVIIVGVDLLSALFLIFYSARFGTEVRSRQSSEDALPKAQYTDVDEEE
jgi:hypothetical protein